LQLPRRAATQPSRLVLTFLRRKVATFRRKVASRPERLRVIGAKRQEWEVLRTKSGFRRWLIAVPKPRPSMRWPAGRSTAPLRRSATGWPVRRRRPRPAPPRTDRRGLGHGSCAAAPPRAVSRSLNCVAIYKVRSWPDAADLALQPVGSYLGYTGRDANVVAKAARDPRRSSGASHRGLICDPRAAYSQQRDVDHGHRRATLTVKFDPIYLTDDGAPSLRFSWLDHLLH
jgi:hypothetical protein